MSLATEYTLRTVPVERVATIKLVRVVDLEKIAAESTDGMISVEALQTAGDYVVIIQPNGRGAEPVRCDVADEVAGATFIDGFLAAVNLKKKGPRKADGKADGKEAKPRKKPAQPKPKAGATAQA